MTKYLIKYVYTVLRIIGFGILGLFLLFFILTIVINLTPVQNKLANWAVSKVENKIKTKITVGEIAINLPYSVSVKDIFIADIHSDTLINAGMIEIAINPLTLLHKEISITRLKIAHSTIHMSRYADSTFNFQHYIKAFGADGKKSKTKEDSSRNMMSFSIKNINIESVFFSYYDAANKNRYKTNLNKLKIAIKTIDLQKNLIDISGIQLANSSVWVDIYSKQNNKPEPIGIDIRLDKKLEIEHVNFYLNDHFFKQNLSIENAHLLVTPKSLNLPKYAIDLKNVTLSDTKTKFHILKTDQTDSVRITRFKALSYTQAFPWNINAENLDLSQNSFIFIDDNISPVNTGIDFRNLQLSSIGGSMKHIDLSRNHLSVNVKDFNLKEISGFQLDEL
jgi:hypothetical protein